MTRLWRLLVMLVVVASAVFAVHGPGSVEAQTEATCFPETGFCIQGRIREYWQQNGGLSVFGYPTTDQHVEKIEGRDFIVQWFQRHRLELHPENARPYDVLIGRLGADRIAQQGRDWYSFPKSAPQNGCRYFPETGHNVCGAILQAWRSNGLELDGKRGKTEAESLALFGLPLSDAQVETLSDGKQYVVQWFERVRAEEHPENQPPYNVLFGLLGNEIREGAPKPDPCADVPEPVDGRIRPSKCVKEGTDLELDIFGFQPNEQIGFWLTTPDGGIYGTIQTYDIGPTGAVSGLPFSTDDLEPGLWFWVFEGTSSKHKSVIYFRIL